MQLRADDFVQRHGVTMIMLAAGRTDGGELKQHYRGYHQLPGSVDSDARHARAGARHLPLLSSLSRGSDVTRQLVRQQTSVASTGARAHPVIVSAARAAGADAG